MPENAVQRKPYLTLATVFCNRIPHGPRGIVRNAGGASLTAGP